MACQLFDIKPSSEPMLACFQLDHSENWKKSTTVFIQENWFENFFCKLTAILSSSHCVNSLWPSDTIWHQRSWSTLDQVMACCLTAPSHYLNQCWLLISVFLWHSPESNFAVFKLLQCIMILKIILLKLLPHLPGASELTNPFRCMVHHVTVLQCGGLLVEYLYIAIILSSAAAVNEIRHV